MLPGAWLTCGGNVLKFRPHVFLDNMIFPDSKKANSVEFSHIFVPDDIFNWMDIQCPNSTFVKVRDLKPTLYTLSKYKRNGSTNEREVIYGRPPVEKYHEELKDSMQTWAVAEKRAKQESGIGGIDVTED